MPGHTFIILWITNFWHVVTMLWQIYLHMTKFKFVPTLQFEGGWALHISKCILCMYIQKLMMDHFSTPTLRKVITVPWLKIQISFQEKSPIQLCPLRTQINIQIYFVNVWIKWRHYPIEHNSIICRKFSSFVFPSQKKILEIYFYYCCTSKIALTPTQARQRSKKIIFLAMNDVAFISLHSWVECELWLDSTDMF